MRVLDLGDSYNDPTIILERLCKGLWCRMGFTRHLNGKVGKTMFSKPYKFMIHCVVHALSHRKGAYDETSDYIMNIITCLVLNRPYNVSKVIFDYLVENVKAGSTKYIMYPRFIMMMIDDLVKDIQKDDDGVFGLRNMTADTISRLAKGLEPRVKSMICRINNPAYVAPENDAWRHENSSSENENEKMNEMVEKKTRWWFVKDGKRKRTPKTSLVVPIPTEPTPKIVVKGPSKEQKSNMIDEPQVDPIDLSQLGIDLTKATFEQSLKSTKESTQKEQSSSVPTESVKETEPEGVARDDSSETDDESIETEIELDLTTLGRGKAQLRIKRKAHIETSKVLEAEKDQSVENPKEPEVQSVEVPVVEVQKEAGVDVDVDVEITGVRASTPPPPPPPLENAVKALEKKVSVLEQEKAKAEAEHDVLKKQVEELSKMNEEIKTIMIKQEKKLKKMKDGVHDNT
ncbi:hypothetical protein Hanom_Chr02g00136961 [Helianthus anomalus]